MLCTAEARDLQLAVLVSDSAQTQASLPYSCQLKYSHVAQGAWKYPSKEQRVLVVQLPTGLSTRQLCVHGSYASSKQSELHFLASSSKLRKRHSQLDHRSFFTLHFPLETTDANQYFSAVIPEIFKNLLHGRVQASFFGIFSWYKWVGADSEITPRFQEVLSVMLMTLTILKPIAPRPSSPQLCQEFVATMPRAPSGNESRRASATVLDVTGHPTRSEDRPAGLHVGAGT